MGEGDLRYLLEKTAATPAEQRPILNEGEYGSEVQWPPVITQSVDAALARLKAQCPKPWQRVAAAAHVQRELRLQMTRPERFDLAVYEQTIQCVAGYAAKCGRL